MSNLLKQIEVVLSEKPSFVFFFINIVYFLKFYSRYDLQMQKIFQGFFKNSFKLIQSKKNNLVMFDLSLILLLAKFYFILKK